MRYLLCAIGALALAAPALAQSTDSARSRVAAERQARMAARADSMGQRARIARRQVAEGFAERLQRDLDLSEKQRASLRETMTKFNQERVQLDRTQRQLQEHLAALARPDAPSRPSEIRAVLDSVLAGRERELSVQRRELSELRTYLDDVQAARFVILQRRLRERMNGVGMGAIRPAGPESSMRMQRELAELRSQLREARAALERDRGKR